MSGNGQAARPYRLNMWPMNRDATLDDHARYRALCSHDARFDGRFFIGVTSTSIYCRPVCRVRLPRRENCRFFDHAAQAEQAGFRPCLRCRPELAPLNRHWSAEDAGTILARQAMGLLDDPQNWTTNATEGTAISHLSKRLGISDRHLRRIFEAHIGVSPQRYLQTRKLLSAKQLLADTRLPVSQVAHASGFGSLRRFNGALQAHYGLSPTQMRRSQPAPRDHEAAQPGTTARLSWRPPYDATAMLAFLAARQLPGVEWVQPEALSLHRTVRLVVGGQAHSGWLVAQLQPAAHRLVLRASDSLHAVLPSLIWRVRALFDLDADPQAINAVLHPQFPTGDGLRVPGGLDGFELAVRAVLGQQITVAAARTLAQRLVERFGEPIDTPFAGLHRLFPSAHTLANAEPQSLGELGIVRQRQATIQALAGAVAEGSLDLDGQADLPTTLLSLQALPGIGTWTAQYVAMRALRWPDAWPTGDAALHQALDLDHRLGVATRRQADSLASAWRPWRSYAVLRAWAGTYQAPFTTAPQEASP